MVSEPAAFHETVIPMIESARSSQPGLQWTVGDIGDWARRPNHPGENVDLIFSCAALQWVDDHAECFRV
jgi:trans-aconitate methyltransferase